MGVCNIPGAFQEKISKLFEGFNKLHVYIYNVLVTTRKYFIDHLKALEIFLQKLAEAVLKLNAEKSFSVKT